MDPTECGNGNRNQLGKRIRTPDLCQANEDKRRIKTDIKDLLVENHGLKLSNPLTLEQLISDLPILWESSLLSQ